MYLEELHTMTIKSNLEKHTVSWLKRQDSDEKLNKNISIQRKEVWDSEKKSNLIVSLLLDIPIESLLFEETADKKHNVLDGKQRTLTLCAFIDDKFALSPKIRVKEIDGTELSGLKFSELPESMQSQILEYELSISILRPLDSSDRATVFFMRNQAVSLSKMDLSLVMLGEEAMNEFARLSNHNFMLNKIKLTAPARRKHDDLAILLQYIILKKRPDSGFSGTELMSLCDDIRHGVTAIPTSDLDAIMLYLDYAFPEKRAYLKKMQVPIVLYVAETARLKGLPPAEFAQKLDDFFRTPEINSEYFSLCQSGSAKRSNVQARVRILSEIIAK
jgi:hypothetical protein